MPCRRRAYYKMQCHHQSLSVVVVVVVVVTFVFHRKTKRANIAPHIMVAMCLVYTCIKEACISDVMATDQNLVTKSLDYLCLPHTQYKFMASQVKAMHLLSRQSVHMHSHTAPSSLKICPRSWGT